MRPLIAGNWKMNGLKAQLPEISQVARLSKDIAGVDILICPPATLIAAAFTAAQGVVAIGGQDCDTEDFGPYTGAVSAEMLKDAGASTVILGHSERRQGHGETDAIVAAKARAAHRAGLTAIICVGESQAQRQAGEAFTVCARQIAGSVPRDLPGLSLIIAYEPLWAIGSQHGAPAKDIAEMHAHIRRALVEGMGARGESVRILYGGSVDAGNTRDILSLPEVGGALVGRASLEADDFEAVIMAAATVAT